MKIQRSEYQEELEIAVEAAESSGDIMDNYREEKISVKDTKSSEVDIITQADHDCQEKIVEIIEEEFPEDGFIGEENLNSKSENSRNWVIDPIDGTLNFKKGHKYFCTSIALEVDGETKVGVVYSPESGLDQLFYSVEGEGAYIRRDEHHEELRPSNHRGIEGGFFQLTFIKKHSDSRWKTHQKVLESFRARDARYLKQGSLALSACKVAEGVFDGVIEYGWKWDFSAARLILSEAGGSYRYRPEKSEGLDEFIGCNGRFQEELNQLLDDSRP